MKIITEKLNWLFGPTSAFKAGDCVQLRGDDQLMVVIEVINRRGMKQALIHCEWHETSPKQTRTNLFPEDRLVHFDWYAAHRAVQAKEECENNFSVENSSFSHNLMQKNAG